MATLTYCKGLPTPVHELNELGFTDFEVFLGAYAQIFRAASIQTVDHLLFDAEFKKSEWNTHLQQTYGINKRHANDVISSASCRVDGAKAHRILHLKTLEGKIKYISAYSEFYKQLSSILSNRGIELITVNPAYSSIIGLVKYLRMYGLASDEAAALVIARRVMKLSEKMPRFLTAYSEVNSEKHEESEWNQLNKKIKHSAVISRRCDYYSVSNWSFLVNLDTEEA